MQVGDREWRDKAARVIRDARRIIDRDFAKRVAREVRAKLAARESLKDPKLIGFSFPIRLEDGTWIHPTQTDQ